jgi:hypothetical protein
MAAGCSDPKTAKKTLENSGYTNIELGGYSFFGCSDGDRFSTKFTATNPNGVTVSGVVCSGWFKGGTIRF